MAKQVGSKKITGTIDGICFYIREGAYLARAESSLDTKRYYSDPAFEGSRRSNERMTKASPMASKLYKLIQKDKKGRSVFNKLVGGIKVKIKEGWDEKDIEVWFREDYLREVEEKVKVEVEVEEGNIEQGTSLPDCVTQAGNFEVRSMLQDCNIEIERRDADKDENIEQVKDLSDYVMQAGHPEFRRKYNTEVEPVRSLVMYNPGNFYFRNSLSRKRFKTLKRIVDDG